MAGSAWPEFTSLSVGRHLGGVEAEAPLGQPALVLHPAPHARPVALAVAGVRRLPVAAAHRGRVSFPTQDLGTWQRETTRVHARSSPLEMRPLCRGTPDMVGGRRSTHASRFRTRRGAVEGAALGLTSSCTAPAHAYPQCFRLVTYRYSNVPVRSHPSTRPSNLGPVPKLTPCGFCDVLAFLQQQRCCIIRVSSNHTKYPVMRS